MTMKLLTGDLSPYSARVRMQIYAKGLESEVEMAPADGLRTPAFIARYPLGRIPILEVGGEAIPESAVIAQYLEEAYPTPSLLGATALENARIRALEHVGDIHIMNPMYSVNAQGRRSTRNIGIRDLLAGLAIRGVEALERMVGTDGFACLGRLTLADCALLPGLFLVQTIMPTIDLPDPIPGLPRVNAYWQAIQRHPIGARVMIELNRGLEGRRAILREAALQAKAAPAG